MLHNFDLLSFVSLTDAEKEKINNRALKSRSSSGSVLQAGEKFSRASDSFTPPTNLDQLGEMAQHLLKDKNLEVSKVKPFFWLFVETYVDRFQTFPFDTSKALFCHLELRDYPEHEFHDLIAKLEALYEDQYGRPLHPVADSVPEKTQQLKSPKRLTTKSDSSASSKKVVPESIATEPKLAEKLPDVPAVDDYSESMSLDDEIDSLRDCLKYAALVSG